MKLIVISIVAWIAGLGSYLAVGWLLWQQRISPGDLRATLFLSLLVVTVSVAAGYAPLLFLLRRYDFFERRGWTFPAVAIALGIVPLYVIGAFAGGRGTLITPESFLFACMFGMFGLVFGAGFYRWYVRP